MMLSSSVDAPLPLPARAFGGRPVRTIAAGWRHALAVTASGALCAAAMAKRKANYHAALANGLHGLAGLDIGYPKSEKRCIGMRVELVCMTCVCGSGGMVGWVLSRH